MRLSLIIPVYNEAHHLKAFFDNLLTIPLPCEVEYVIIDDASTDESWGIVEAFVKTVPPDKVVAYRQSNNQGKGAALHRGIALARGQFIVIQDADFEYDPRDLAHLVEPILSGKADVVYGSRFHKTNPQVHRTFHYLVNRFLTLVSNVMSGLYLSDMETCYKVFRSEILKPLPLECKRFGFEPEVTALVAKLKIRVHEYPISYFPRTYSEGKKINWKDGVAALWFIFKYNLRGIGPPTVGQIPTQYLPRARQWL